MRLVLSTALVVAAITLCVLQAHAADVSCPKPVLHKKHHVKAAPVASCVAPLPLILALPEPIPEPIVVTRYIPRLEVDAPNPPPAVAPLAYPEEAVEFVGFDPLIMPASGGLSLELSVVSNVTVSKSYSYQSSVSTVTNNYYAPLSSPKHCPPPPKTHGAPELSGEGAIGGLTILFGLLAIAKSRRYDLTCPRCFRNMHLCDCK